MSILLPSAPMVCRATHGLTNAGFSGILWEVLGCMGSGDCGEVWVATHGLTKSVAVTTDGLTNFSAT